MKRYLGKVLATLIIAVGLLSAPAAIKADTPNVSGSEVRGFYRLTFEWPRPTYITAGVDGQTLNIKFSRKVDTNMTEAIKEIKKIAHSYTLSTDGRRLSVKLKGNYRVRSFMSGNVNGVDIIPSQAKFAKPKIIGKDPTKLTQLSPAAGADEPKKFMTLKERIAAKKAKEAQKAEKPVNSEKPAPKAKVEKPVAKQAENQQEQKLEEETAKELAETKPAEGSESQKEEKAEEVAASEPVASEPVASESAEKAVADEEETVQEATEDKPEVVEPEKEAAVANQVSEETQEGDVSQEVEGTNLSQKPEAEESETEKAESTQESEAVVAEDSDVKQEQEEITEEASVEEKKPAEVESAAKEEEASEPVAVQEDEAEEMVDEDSDEGPDVIEDVTEEAEGEENVARKLRVRGKLRDEVLTLEFPWQKRTAVAAYVRNNIAWIVFDKVATLDLRQANNLLRAGVSMKQLPTNEATVLYMPISNGAGIELRGIEGTFRWEVKVLAGQKPTAKPVKLLLQTEPPIKPHVFLPFLEVADVVRIKDPVVGDDIDVLPVYAIGSGVSPARSFPEFNLLETVQGLAVLRKSNDATVDIVRNGVRVSTHRGAVISADLPAPEEVKKEEFSEEGVLFDYSKWKVLDSVSPTAEIDIIKKQIARSLVRDEVGYFLRLAQIHLAYGEAVEALGYLHNIKRMDSDFFIRKRLSAMQGGANFLLHRYADAARNFRVRELKDLEEVEFWDVMLAELLGKPNQQFDYEGNYEKYIQHYPPILQQRIGIFAADRYIAGNDYNAALQVFDQLNEHKLIDEVADYINYLMGKIALETQTPEDGYRLWNKIITEPATEFVKVRAEFSLIIELMRRGKIPEEVAIERLERLAIRWRGDNLELAVLTALSDIYESTDDWPNAIRIWRAMNEAFPNSAEAVEATRKMDEAFVAIFDKGETGKLADLDLLFLYNEHRELIPDDEVGDRIVERLADLMIKLDMLEQASELLEDRMRYRFEHVERSKVGAKLAEVLLLDKKPKKALEALQLSVFGLLPEELLEKRNYLSAEALLQLGRTEDLFLLLQGDESDQANYYRLQSHWQNKDWRALAEMGEQILKSRTNPAASLTATEKDTLIKLAMAYVAMEEPEQTAYLRDYFTPLMKGQDQAEVFSYLTQPYLTLTPDNFDQVVQLLDKTHTFLSTNYGTKEETSEGEEEQS